jgi:sugar phosphate isomerase/epimerase
MAAGQGITALHCAVGAGERFEDVVRWKKFVGEAVACLQRLAPVLHDHGLRIGIENHWDLTTYEIFEMVERVGSDVVGFGLDTGNILALAEGPEQAIDRALPYTVTTHLKDAYLFSTELGAARPVVPLGQGQIGIAEVVHELCRREQVINITIEDHNGIWPVHYFETAWLEAVPELTAHDIATTARLSRQGDRLLAEHRIEDPHTADLIPWSIKGGDRLRSDIVSVREMVHTAWWQTRSFASLEQGEDGRS